MKTTGVKRAYTFFLFIFLSLFVLSAVKTADFLFAFISSGQVAQVGSTAIFDEQGDSGFSNDTNQEGFQLEPEPLPVPEPLPEPKPISEPEKEPAQDFSRNVEPEIIDERPVDFEENSNTSTETIRDEIEVVEDGFEEIREPQNTATQIDPPALELETGPEDIDIPEEQDFVEEITDVFIVSDRPTNVSTSTARERFPEEDEDILSVIELIEEIVDEEEELFERRLDRDLRVDSDEDGISDYDEVVIYKTNPFDAYTVDGKFTDAQKILAGIDPLSEEERPIVFESPKNAEVPILPEFTVETIKVTETRSTETPEVEEAAKISFSGTGLPNSFVTLYIFSTPIVVTVRTDAEGKWEYELDKQLENGKHELYVATVDNSGKIIARSEAIPFVKEASAAVLGNEIPVVTSESPATNNFTIGVIVFAIVGVIAMIVAVGFDMRRAKRDYDVG